MAVSTVGRSCPHSSSLVGRCNDSLCRRATRRRQNSIGKRSPSTFLTLHFFHFSMHVKYREAALDPNIQPRVSEQRASFVAIELSHEVTYCSVLLFSAFCWNVKTCPVLCHRIRHFFQQALPFLLHACIHHCRQQMHSSSAELLTSRFLLPSISSSTQHLGAYTGTRQPNAVQMLF